MKDASVVEQAKPLQSLNRWLEIVTKFLVTISAIMVILMSGVTAYSVVRRYFLHSPDNNAFLAICIITLTFVVFSWAEVQRIKKQIVVDYFSERFSKKVQEILQNVIAPVLGLIFCGVLAWKNWTGAAFSLQIGERTVTNFTMPVFPLKAMITFGVILICLVLVVQLLTYLAALRYRTAHKKPEATQTVQSI